VPGGRENVRFSSLPALEIAVMMLKSIQRTRKTGSSADESVVL